MHSTSNLDDGYLGSGKRVIYSINKYGVENHVREILEFVESRETLKIREAEIVNLNEIAKDSCMNLVIGGSGGWTNEQQKENSKKGKQKMKYLLENDPVWSAKYRANLSKAMKKRYAKCGQFYDWNGKKHSEETKKKMSLVKKGKYTGKKNSQYGTCWITKDGLTKKIKKTDINSFESEGWVKGRKK